LGGIIAPAVAIPVDAVRDFWDWLALVVGIVASLVGLTVGVIATALARRANKHPVRCPPHAVAANLLRT
jgi:hypothetical protein